MQRRVLVACVRHLTSFHLVSLCLLIFIFHQEKGPLAFDLTDRLLREGHKVVVIGELQMDASRNLKTMSNLFNLELTKFVLLIPTSI
jgi:hypothetical protein